MLVERIKYFIIELAFQTDELTGIEAVFYEELRTRFERRGDKESLNSEDQSFLEAQLAKRWSAIKMTDRDYTLDAYNTLNQLWISLAKDLARSPLSSKTYIQLLFPNAINTEDPISKKPLSGTECVDHLFWGDGDILYRKKGLCSYLINNGYNLSTFRDMAVLRKAYPLSIYELIRLKACKPGKDSGFAIINAGKEEQFTSFWEFLKQKVLPMLNRDNKIPSLMLAHFLSLLNHFFELQKAEKSFSLFKEELTIFCHFLNKQSVESVNQFYGFYIDVEGKKYYLLDLLIILNEAVDYDFVDYPFDKLIAKLFTINPSFSSAFFPQRYSAGLTRASLDERSLSLKNTQLTLLSLFTFEFDDATLLGNPKITMWDRVHTVPKSAQNVYKWLEPALNAGDEDVLLASFEEVRRREDHEFGILWSMLFPAPSSKQVVWIEHVKKGTLDSIGYRWVDSELLFHALIRFRAMNSDTELLIKKFLDELLHTWCQSAGGISEYHRELRINILFFELMQTMPKRDYLALVMLLDLYHAVDYKSLFIKNVLSYLRISLGLEPPSPTFFAISTVKDKEVLKAPTTVLEVVEGYKVQIRECRKNSEKEALIEYLLRLTVPILTRSDMLTVKRSTETRVDSLGAAT